MHCKLQHTAKLVFPAEIDGLPFISPCFVEWLETFKGVNSFVSRSIKKMMTSTKEQGKDVQIFIVGEKGRSQLARVYADVSRIVCATMNSGIVCY